jgi:MYXO-CTERM domain-containing protein
MSATAIANHDGQATETEETFEAVDTPWSIFVAPHTENAPPGTVWIRGPLPFIPAGFFGFNAFTNVQSDESIVSPPLVVAATGDLTLSFKHLFSPLTAGSQLTTSGVVVEISSNDGVDWTDVADVPGVSFAMGYTGTIDTAPDGTPDYERNPLEGHDAYTGINPAPLFDAETINLHAVYAGETVLVRFRYGSALVDGGTFWLYELNTFDVTGITNTPFFSDVTDQGICVPIPDAGPDQEVNEQSVATLHGAASDLTGQPVTHTWSQVDGPAVTLSDVASFTPSFTAPLVDSDQVATFKLTAVGTNGTRTALTHVTIKDVGHPPVARITGAGVTIAPGASVNLSASSSTDPDNDALTYTWSQASGPAGTFSSATGGSTTFKASSTAGAVTIGLKATDSHGLTNSTTGALTVKTPEDEGCSSTTGTPASALALVVVGAFLLLRRRSQV